MRPIKTAVLVTALILAGCSSGGGGSSAAPAPATGSASPAPSATWQTGSAPSPSATTTGGNGSGPARCHTSDLKVSWSSDPGGGAAGSHGEFLLLENTSKSTCTLYGYPGVSFVAGEQGKQVGDAFSRTDAAKKTITLKPGATAHAQLIIGSWENYDEATCAPVKVRGYRVYPPDEKAAVFVSRPQTACSAKNTGVGQVFPIAAGTP